MIFDMDPPIEIFTQNEEYRKLLKLLIVMEFVDKKGFQEFRYDHISQNEAYALFEIEKKNGSFFKLNDYGYDYGDLVEIYCIVITF